MRLNAGGFGFSYPAAQGRHRHYRGHPHGGGAELRIRRRLHGAWRARRLGQRVREGGRRRNSEIAVRSSNALQHHQEIGEATADGSMMTTLYMEKFCRPRLAIERPTA